jgi:dihydrofolate synthase / folylpolyglutamate synthase
MNYLGNPENKLRTIHIAGTSGKTSTAYYIAGLLNLAGQNVGLTVSPHIDKISERTQINGKPLEETIFCERLAEFLELVDESNIKPSYFELIYAFSIWAFAQLKVDYAVIETGLGGLYDATNVVNREDKVCVITDIGYDHINILGHTIQEIAAQKVGIVHNNNPLLMYRQDAEVMSVINKWAEDHNADKRLTDQSTEMKEHGQGTTFNNLPDFQKRNWLLAYYVYRFVAARDSLKELSAGDLAKSQQTIIPARMDISYVGEHQMVMDGAHNYQKMTAFISSYKHMFPDAKPAVLLAFKRDKAYMETLPMINDLASEIIVTTFKSSQDLPVVSGAPEEIAAELKRIGTKRLRTEPDNVKAYKLLLESDAKQLIITGSFYLIAQVREKLR